MTQVFETLLHVPRDESKQSGDRFCLKKRHATPRPTDPRVNNQDELSCFSMVE
jgi:hypothetical protein